MPERLVGPEKELRHQQEPAWLMRWLTAVAVACVLMIVVGGLVRLTHSGLSMTSWRPVTGVVPPLSEAQWQVEFNAYRQTPEYQQVNTGMSLAEFQGIFWPEFIHRIIGRLVGLVVGLPLLYGLVRRQLPAGVRPHAIGIGLLFLGQGVMGWLMVKSGLVDDPKVSPYRLALHLFLALVLMAWGLWLIFQRRWPVEAAVITARSRTLANWLLGMVVVQIVLGALVAGHRAGHASDTFPLMHNRLIPHGLASDGSWLANLVANPLTVHFEHRWFAFVVIGLSGALFLHLRNTASAHQEFSAPLKAAGTGLLYLLILQIVLGIATILYHVPVWLASLHQLGGVAIFGLVWLVFHQTRQGRQPV